MTSDPDQTCSDSVNLPAGPCYAYDTGLASHLLETAGTYLAHAGDLVYSFGSKTFLSGYDLFEPGPDGRGYIDCSTFIYLVLAGISYEQSPYKTGTTKDLSIDSLTGLDFSCFHNIPERYLNIAERIGRPYLSCPKGLDLDKAYAMGISRKVLIQEIRSCGMSRRSVDLAGQFLKQGACFTDAAFLKPGDLVFYQSKSFFRDGNFKPSGISEVTHVGMIWKDTDFMINSSGYLDKERERAEGLPSVSIAPVRGKRTPLFYARVKTAAAHIM